MWLLVFLSLAGAQSSSGTRGLDTLEVEEPKGFDGLGIAQYRALLFSAADYASSSGIPDLETPKRDVTEIGRVLEERYGFQTDVVIDATEADIIARLDQLKATTGPDDGVLIYYAGHGLYDEAEDRGYWLPVDAQLAETSRWISNDDVAAKLRAIPARHVLMVADSCFSGMFRDAVRPTQPSDDLRPLQALAHKRSRVVLTSGGNEPVSDRGRDGMSVFAYFLRQGLAEAPGRYVVVDTLFPELRSRVQQNAEQTPQQGIFQRAFHEGGQMVLVNESAPPGTVVTQATAREAAQRQCHAQGRGDREAYETFGAAGPADQLAQLEQVAADQRIRQRMTMHACVDHAMGLITDREHRTLTALLAGDGEARTSLGQAALAEQRAEAREVPPPGRCEVTSADEAAVLVRAQRLLQHGTSGSNRPQDRQAQTMLEAAATSRSSAPLWAAVARARLYADGDPTKVANAADKAASACPAWGVPDSYRAAAWVLANDLGAAQKALTRAVSRSPEFAFAHFNLGGVELALGNVDAGMAALQHALARDPLLGEAHYLRGQVLQARGQLDAALTAYASAADLSPKNRLVWEALAAAHRAAGNHPSATAAQKRADSL